MRIGIELECWVIDRDGRLRSAAALAEACPSARRECVDPIIEITTEPVETVPAAIESLATGVEDVLSVACEQDLRLAPMGTPLADAPIPLADDSGDRIAIQRAILGEDFAHARPCAGTHIHFEQTAPLDQLRALTALDPAFALVNSAPYYRGRRSLACARPYAYRRRCYRSLPWHGQLWPYPRSIGSWRRRIDNRFREFVAAGQRRGIDRSRIGDAFGPEDAVWTPVRLRDDLGTVEWRSPDAAPLLDICRLLADIARVVRRAAERGTVIGSSRRTDAMGLPPYARLRQIVAGAMAEGVRGPGVNAHLEKFDIDPTAYRPLGNRIDGRRAIDPAAARRLRRRFADRLEWDLQRIRDAGVEALAGAGPVMPT